MFALLIIVNSVILLFNHQFIALIQRPRYLIRDRLPIQGRAVLNSFQMLVKDLRGVSSQMKCRYERRSLYLVDPTTETARRCILHALVPRYEINIPSCQFHHPFWQACNYSILNFL